MTLIPKAARVTLRPTLKGHIVLLSELQIPTYGHSLAIWEGVGGQSPRPQRTQARSVILGNKESPTTVTVFLEKKVVFRN